MGYECCTNKELITLALKTYPKALKYALGDVRKNEEFVIKCCIIDSRNFKYASGELLNDKNFIKRVLNIPKFELMHSCDIINNDKELALLAVSKWKNIYFYLSDDLQGDHDILDLI